MNHYLLIRLSEIIKSLGNLDTRVSELIIEITIKNRATKSIQETQGTLISHLSTMGTSVKS